jgi:hypothetical protein
LWVGNWVVVVTASRPSGFRVEGKAEPLPATLPHAWSAKGRQDFRPIANDDTTGGGVC